MRRLLTAAMLAMSLAVSLAASMTVATAQTRGSAAQRYDYSRGYSPGYEDKAYNRDGW